VEPTRLPEVSTDGYARGPSSTSTTDLSRKIASPESYRRRWSAEHLITLASIAVLTALAPAERARAQAERDLPNPILSSTIGDAASYHFELSTPERAQIGSITIARRKGNSLAVANAIWGRTGRVRS